MRVRRPEKLALYNPDDVVGDSRHDNEKKEKFQRFVSLLRVNYSIVIPWLKSSLLASPENIGSNNFFDLDDERKRRVKDFFEIIKEAGIFLAGGGQAQHLTHDVSSKTLRTLKSYMEVIDEDFFQGNVRCNNDSKRGLKIFYSVLNRWYVSVEDLLLRGIDSHDVAKDNVVPMDVDKLSSICNHFKEEGVDDISVDEKERVDKGSLSPENRQYSQIDNKNFFIEFSEDELKQ